MSQPSQPGGQHLPVNPNDPHFNMAELLEHWARVQPDSLAVAVGKGQAGDAVARFAERTFAELNTLANRYAHALQARGLQRGDRVLLFVTDPIEFFAWVFACCKCQVVFVLIDPGMGVKAMIRCVEEQKPKCMIGVAKAHVLRTLFPQAFKGCRLRFLVGGSFFPGAVSASRAIARLPEQAQNAPTRSDASSEDIAAIFYTSGSTGFPKGVVFTHAMMGGQANAIGQLFDFRPGEAHVACFPLFALIAGSLGMSAVVPTMNVAKPADTAPQAVIAAFHHYRAKSGFGSPALWEPFSRFIEAAAGTEAPVLLPDVTRLLTAGAPVSPALHERLLSALPHGDVFTPYGATEALPVAFIGGREVLTKTAERTRDGAGTCVGLPVSGVDVRIIDISDDVVDQFQEDMSLPAGEIGEIIVRGPLISRTYDQRPDATQLSKINAADGTYFHRMGDVGYLDDEGRLWFCGRKSHRVQQGDTLLFSVPCEAIAETHPQVYRAALVWAGERPEQTPVMCIELEKNVGASPRLLSEVKELLSAHTHTRMIDHVLSHPGFPVDRRHNAKIEREQLSLWAEKQLRKTSAHGRAA